MKKKTYSEGDILLWPSGNMARVESIDSKGAIEYLQYVSVADPCRCIYGVLSPPSASPDIAKNLGQSPAILATFYAARSLHLRLNKINNI